MIMNIFTHFLFYTSYTFSLKYVLRKTQQATLPANMVEDQALLTVRE